ncbi:MULTISPECIES: glycoside hydrolase [Acidobacterium]|uniref:BNR/Asp-box repeat protein n=1 Tax=Acidobacterium capsulatum (strain ATCC 51196 / DSM 11244 / BCRC 80197 / JCM 7670 / NBRC 15755 / NCIMB 13165 / 161) TaxID=240015 RepID=C1F5I3_ACIC5|nr:MULTISPECIES: glycoside hydrolase [Acidobacterium]ACO32902.1 BNR/Asp-box repeat protein [Acidobacterium capsulatum ATCC 51196]HCT60805.1 glycoside hydrolase [Acidobacterium sp.]
MRTLPALLSVAALALSAAVLPGHAQAVHPSPAAVVSSSTYSHDLHWRLIGPFRGGRTRAVSGVPSEPNVFYVGAVDGGVWKTNDYGRTWHPIFDHEPTGSIGALAVAPSDPKIIYVASGEGLHRPDLSVGDGIYKSTDAGKTWTRLGLRNVQQFSQMAVDPTNPDRVFVAAAGHPYGPNSQRGIYRSLDGGKTWQKVLYVDENTGGNDVRIDPKNPQIVYATLWEAREGPWENGEFSGPEGGIYKSTDGGSTWKKLHGGLPDDIIQAYVAISPSHPSTLFASVAVPGKVQLYRSEDGGQTWTAPTTDARPKNRIGGGDLPMPAIDPEHPNVFYMTSIVTWKSEDSGHTWHAFRGAPGGDDYQNIWINPHNSKVIALVGDQGALVTVNGGQTWSSWYNQPTAQIYHVAADNAFPYRLCGGQQESGSVCIQTRGNDGEINFRNWHPVGAEEYGYVAPDPLDPDIVYGGKLTKWNRATGQVQDVLPVPLRNHGFRAVRTEPLMFSPVNPHLLYFAANTLWESYDGGNTWKQISPDLSRKTWAIPSVVGIYSKQPDAQPKDRGVIYALAPSPLNVNRIWAGTDDGLIWLTTDGGQHWKNVTPPEMKPWQKISILDAGHFDPNTAYAAVNTLRLDDLHPYIYRTHDGGKTWTKIVNGLPDDEDVNVVRQDPKVKGLLYCGTERTVYVSFDDGDHWQPLRMNLPATSIRDLILKNDDLAIATHGRGFWVMDDITPLRQWKKVAGNAPALMRPALAYRVHWDTNTDTPLAPDEPHADNPPDGAILDYWLPADAQGAVTLTIRDAAGHVVRQYSSATPVPPTDPKLMIPAYWLRPAQHLSAQAGLHRFVWDLHFTPVAGIPAEYPIAAVPHDTAPAPTSPFVLPGQYTVQLTVNGKTYAQPLVIREDPRVKTPMEGLEAQFALSDAVYRDLKTVQAVIDKASATASKPEVAELVGEQGGFEEGPRQMQPTLYGMRGMLLQMLTTLQGADVAPTQPQHAAVKELHGDVEKLLARAKALGLS